MYLSDEANSVKRCCFHTSTCSYPSPHATPLPSLPSPTPAAPTDIHLPRDVTCPRIHLFSVLGFLRVILPSVFLLSFRMFMWLPPCVSLIPPASFATSSVIRSLPLRSLFFVMMTNLTTRRMEGGYGKGPLALRLDDLLHVHHLPNLPLGFLNFTPLLPSLHLTVSTWTYTWLLLPALYVTYLYNLCTEGNDC